MVPTLFLKAFLEFSLCCKKEKGVLREEIFKKLLLMGGKCSLSFPFHAGLWLLLETEDLTKLRGGCLGTSDNLSHFFPS